MGKYLSELKLEVINYYLKCNAYESIAKHFEIPKFDQKFDSDLYKKYK